MDTLMRAGRRLLTRPSAASDTAPGAVSSGPRLEPGASHGVRIVELAQEPPVQSRTLGPRPDICSSSQGEYRMDTLIGAGLRLLT